LLANLPTAPNLVAYLAATASPPTIPAVFAVARGRLVSYMKWVVMTCIRILLTHGDFYFRRRTLEDIPTAIQHLYGPSGEQIPKRGKKRVETYFSLLDKWYAFSNAVVQLELAFPFSNQTWFPFGVVGGIPTDLKINTDQLALANIFGFATSSYFCLPDNPELWKLRAMINLWLHNIRNCLDIDGKPLPLSLWKPPIDPGELVKSVAEGLSLSSALNDLNAILPNYRFAWLHRKAIELCGKLKTLENSFLSIKEKRNGEAL
jgi:hypothetical protein